MASDHEKTRDLTDDVELEDLVKELDAILDAWFMTELEPVISRELKGELKGARAIPVARPTAA